MKKISVILLLIILLLALTGCTSLQQEDQRNYVSLNSVVREPGNYFDKNYTFKARVEKHSRGDYEVKELQTDTLIWVTISDNANASSIVVGDEYIWTGKFNQGSIGGCTNCLYMLVFDVSLE